MEPERDRPDVVRRWLLGVGVTLLIAGVGVLTYAAFVYYFAAFR